MNGNIKFQTTSTSWNANFTGETSKNGFSSSSVSDNGRGNDVGVINGDLQGKFYGDKAQGVGGKFNLDAIEGHKASGVFKASK